MVLGRAMGNLGLTRLTTAQTWGSHYLPLYNILCASPQGPHPNGFLFRGSQVGIPKFPHLGLPWLWGRITSCVDLQLQWGLKQSCSPHWELSNNMSHATCTLGNQVDSQLLVVWLPTLLLIITCVLDVQMGDVSQF